MASRVWQVLKTQYWIGESAEMVAAKAAKDLNVDALIVLSLTRPLEDEELEQRYFPLDDEKVTFAEALPWIDPSEMPCLFGISCSND